MDFKDKNILLFCPSFFDYEKHIKSALEDYGANVIWFDDRPANDFITKAIIRVNKRIVNEKVVLHYKTIITEVLEQNLRIDCVLFVNPEAVSASILRVLRERFNKAKLILYMWDSFRNKKWTLELLPFFDAKFTFDPNDATAYNLKFTPLFYIDTYRSLHKEIKYDLLFTGTAHSDRYIFVKKIASAENPKITVQSFFYLSSHFLYLVKKLADKNFREVGYKDISFKKLTHSDIAKYMSKSKAVLDINHPQQIGLTMRTFEVIGAQCKLITTNVDIKNYDFYNENNILIVDRENPLINEEFLTKPFQPYPKDILFKYSIKGWISQLFVNF